MQDLEIIIKLDPIHDGIKDFFNVGKIEDRRGLLISTTGKYKTIDGDELEAIINQFDENGLTIDVYVSIKAGYAINEVAEKIQKNIHQMIYHMTSVKTFEIYVHVVSIDFE